MGRYLPWLADCARSTGLPVVELVNWRNHHHGPMANHIYGTMCHHTGGPDPRPGATNDFPSIGIVRNGRPGLAGPLAQYGLGWNGTVYVIAGGLAYHGGTGSYRNVSGNSRWIGIEAEDAGDGDWSPPQLAAYPRLVAAIQRWLGQDAGWVCAHREYAPGRKIDPAGIDMGRFRIDVARYLQGTHEEDDMTPEQDRLLREVHKQLHGPWNTWRFGVDRQESRTLVDLVRGIDLELVSRIDLAGRPGPESDTTLGQVASIRADVRALRTQLNEIEERLPKT